MQCSNVSQLKPAWTFSTGVLRGHEGSPLVGLLKIKTQKTTKKQPKNNQKTPYL
jgi:glucose dehydrogenase